jgi:hypothetical protein
MKHLHSVQMKKTKQYIFSSEEDGEMRVYYLHAKRRLDGRLLALRFYPPDRH